MRRVAAVLLTVMSISAIAPMLYADAYDAAMARGIAAKEKAIDTNDPAAWDETLRLFFEADAIKSTKDSKYELAGAAARLKEDDLAYESYEAAIALGLSGKVRDKAQAFLKTVKMIGRLDVKGPAGAEIYVGARFRGTLPHAPFVIFSGAVKIRAVHGGQTVEQSVTIKEGSTETLTVDFAPKAATSAAPTTSASSAPIVAPGKHGSETVPLADTGAGARTLGWSMIVGGGIVLIVGTGGFIVSTDGVSSGKRDLEKNCAEFYTQDPDQCRLAKEGVSPDTLASKNTEIRTWKAVRTASLVAGGVGIVITTIGLVRLLTAPPAPRASAFNARLDVGFGYLGLSGTF